MYPEVEEIHGDRKEAHDLEALKGRNWDAVIDTCGYVPRLVRLSAEVLKERVGIYAFVSTLSVYADTSQPGIDESGKVGRLEDPTVEEVTGETYGPLKALCEEAVEDVFPGKALIIRPGLIVGPHDPTDRFTYWPWRVALGREVLAPGKPKRGVQFIDVRDLAEWTIRMVEEGHTGIFNADGPAEMISMGELLNVCKEASGSDADFTWLYDEWLLEHNVGPWVEMPLWIPESDPDAAGFFSMDVRKAVEAGLKFRPIEETVRATLEWARTRLADYKSKAGPTREREGDLLREWKAQPSCG